MRQRVLYDGSCFHNRWLVAAAMIILSALLATRARAAPEPWSIAGKEVGAVFPHAEMFLDRTLTLDFAAVQAPAQAAQFIPLAQASYNKPPLPGALWVRFAVTNPSAALLERVLFVDNRSIDELDVWLDEPGGTWTHYCSSQKIPISERIITATTPMFPLMVAPGATRHVVMRFNSDIMTATAELLTLTEILARERLRHLVCGMLFGLVLLVTAYSALLYVQLREGLNAWLSVTGVGMLMFIAFYVWGDAFTWFPESIAAYCEQRGVLMGVLVTSLGLSGFLRQILVLRTTAPLIGHYTTALNWYCYASIVLCLFVDGFIGSTLSEIAVAGMLVPVGAACWRSLRYQREGRLIAVAMIIVLATSAWPIATARGWTHGTRMTPFAPAVGFTFFMVMLAAAAGYRLEYQRRKREQAIRDRLAEAEKNEALSKTFERYVPKEFLSCLDKTSILEIQRGDRVQRQMSVLFSDIRAFTTMVEGHSHDENFSFINRYFASMEPPIRSAGGFVDSYEGDAMMALFPGKQAGIADDAVAAGIGMLKALAVFNRERGAEGRAPVSIGVGVNTGELILGTIGSAERMKCGVIGDPVNLAARVEGMTKLYGAAMLITEFTYSQLRHPVELREVDRVKVKGKRAPVTVYEVLDGLPDEERGLRLANRPQFAQGLALFRRGEMQAAMACFEAVIAGAPRDVAAQLYIDRCRKFLRDGVPKDWNGVMALHTK